MKATTSSTAVPNAAPPATGLNNNNNNNNNNSSSVLPRLPSKRGIPTKLHGLVKRLGNQLAIATGNRTKGKDFLKVYLKKFDSDEVEVLRKVYKELSARSKNGCGIDKATFLQYFPLPGLWGERLFLRFDYKGIGCVDYEEFLVGLAVCCRGTKAEKTTALFQIFDLNADGVLQRSELVTMLSNLPQLHRYLKTRRNNNKRGVSAEEQPQPQQQQQQQQPCKSDAALPLPPSTTVRAPALYSSASSSSSSDGGVADWPSTTEAWARFGFLSDGEDDQPAQPSSASDADVNDSDLEELEAEERELFAAAELWRRHRIHFRRHEKTFMQFEHSLASSSSTTPQQQQQQHVVPPQQQQPLPAALPPPPQPQVRDSSAETKQDDGDSVDVEQFVDSVLEECEFGDHDALTLIEFKTWLDRNDAILNMFADCLHEEAWGLHGNALFRGNKGGAVLPLDKLLSLRRLFQQATARSPAAVFASDDELLCCPSCHTLLAVCPACSRSSRLSLEEAPTDVAKKKQTAAAAAAAAAAPGGKETGVMILCRGCGEKLLRCWRCQWPFEEAASMLGKAGVVECEGWLYKASGSGKDWRSRRYFVLVQNLLYYYAKQEDLKPRGFLFLEGCYVESEAAGGHNAPASGPAKFAFALRHGSLPPRILWATSSEDRDRWISALKSAVKQHPFEDGYQLGEAIGQGKFSVVYQARSKATNSEVAVKVIEKSEISESSRDLLRSEIAILRLLRHPHVIKLIEVVDSKEKLYLVTERIYGGELSELLQKRKKLSESLTNKLVSQLLAVVAYLHQCGIIHRDLKPENILLDESKEAIKVTDFGLSCICGVNEYMQHPCGTLAYAAPEILALKSSTTPAQQQRGYNHSIDLWAVGVIMYYLLRGRLPFPVIKADNGQFTVQTDKPLDLDSPSWEDVGSSAKDLLRRLLHPQPEKRISAAEAQTHIWITNPTAVIAATEDEKEDESRGGDCEMLIDVGAATTFTGGS